MKALWALPLVILLAGCSVRNVVGDAGVVQAAPRFPELELKEKLQRGAASKAAPVHARRTISNGRGAEFVVPAGLSYSDSGDLYVSDNNAHTLHLWPRDAAEAGELPAGAAGARLKFPSPVHTHGDKLFVADNDGIKVLSPEGRFERLLRPYLYVHDFAVSGEGTIFASVLVRNRGEHDPLIVELDQKGRVLRRLGGRREPASRDDHENQAFVAVSGTRLVVAYKYRPVVEVYDTDSGELVRSFEVKHPVFEALKSTPTTSAGAATPAEQAFEPRYIAGVKAVNGRIFVCLHLPTPEVWEFSEGGSLSAAFRADGLPTAIHVFGFDAWSSGRETKFAIGVVEPTWAASVSELSVTSD